ncbi:DNA polymerase III, clamp loader complex, gamma/delta/delta subunit [Lipomyces arxii]|uniref:DNA polymerase III, clamp loader complex, gamma/delta/delta subunit n=1 Tax=Lipomyces arxii TaxID=56418 RepID=UPI0034CD36C9
MDIVKCPVCGKSIPFDLVNKHLDNSCQGLVDTDNDNDKSGVTVAVSSGGGDKKRKRDSELSKPLAERARPNNLDDFVGQTELIGESGILRRFIHHDSCPSMILWGPSGVGKTTLARIIASTTKSRFVELSATSASTSDCKKVFDEAKNEAKLTGRRTILFIDEVHRFNKAQQDIFLPYVERGDIVLIGATTENPSFKVNSALLSRCRVFVLQKLSQDEIYAIISRQANDDLTPDASRYLASLADGDGRIALNLLEILLSSTTTRPVSADQASNDLKRSHLVYDRVGDAHYDTISAFHKSVRGSDPDATLYYLARMLESGESPLYVSRRMIRIASEDVGLADESCLPFAIATNSAVEKIGMPECDVVLAHCAVKLALARKSVRVYRAYGAVKQLVSTDSLAGGASIPLHLRNAPTRLMKEIGYGREYKYNPDYKDGVVHQTYMPDQLAGIKFLSDQDLGDLVDE